MKTMSMVDGLDDSSLGTDAVIQELEGHLATFECAGDNEFMFEARNIIAPRSLRGDSELASKPSAKTEMAHQSQHESLSVSKKSAFQSLAVDNKTENSSISEGNTTSHISLLLSNTTANNPLVVDKNTVLESITGGNKTAFESLKVGSESVHKSGSEDNTITHISLVLGNPNTSNPLVLETQAACESLPVSKKTTLESLSVGNINPLESLEVSNTNALESLAVNNTNTLELIAVNNTNALESPTVDNVNVLESLSVSSTNTLESLAVDNTNVFESLSVDNTHALELLPVNNIKAFESLAVDNTNAFGSLTVGNSIALESLAVGNTNVFESSAMGNETSHESLLVDKEMAVESRDSVYDETPRKRFWLSSELLAGDSVDVPAVVELESSDNRLLDQPAAAGVAGATDAAEVLVVAQKQTECNFEPEPSIILPSTWSKRASRRKPNFNPVLEYTTAEGPRLGSTIYTSTDQHCYLLRRRVVTTAGVQRLNLYCFYKERLVPRCLGTASVRDGKLRIMKPHNHPALVEANQVNSMVASLRNDVHNNPSAPYRQLLAQRLPPTAGASTPAAAKDASQPADAAFASLSADEFLPAASKDASAVDPSLTAASRDSSLTAASKDASLSASANDVSLPGVAADVCSPVVDEQVDDPGSCHQLSVVFRQKLPRGIHVKSRRLRQALTDLQGTTLSESQDLVDYRLGEELSRGCRNRYYSQDGHRYIGRRRVLQNDRTTRIYLCCDYRLRRELLCPGSAVTAGDNKLRPIVPHNHRPLDGCSQEPEVFLSAKIKRKPGDRVRFNRRSETSRDATVSSRRSAAEDGDGAAAADRPAAANTAAAGAKCSALGLNWNSVRLMVRRERRRRLYPSGQPVDADAAVRAVADALQLPGAQTSQLDRFAFSVVQADNRVALAFYADGAVSSVDSPTRMYIDISWRAVPVQFSRMLLVSLEKCSVIVPVFFILVSDGDDCGAQETLYTAVFRQLAARVPSVASLVLEWVDSLRRACFVVWPHAQLIANWHYYTQAVRRKVVSLGLLDTCELPDLYVWLQDVLAVPLLPRHLIRDGWRLLIRQVPQVPEDRAALVAELVEYIRDHWMVLSDGELETFNQTDGNAVNDVNSLLSPFSHALRSTRHDLWQFMGKITQCVRVCEKRWAAAGADQLRVQQARHWRSHEQAVQQLQLQLAGGAGGQLVEECLRRIRPLIRNRISALLSQYDDGKAGDVDDVGFPVAEHCMTAGDEWTSTGDVCNVEVVRV